MSELVERITEVLEQHRPYGLDCKCGEAINSDAWWAAHVAERIAEALQLTEQWAVEIDLGAQRVLCEPTPFPPRGELSDDDAVFSRWVTGWTTAEEKS